MFIRLGGCNLACKFCDTEFEKFSAMDAAEVAAQAARLSEGKGMLAVITGGEPFRQPIEKLCSLLLEKGFKVQIETNGTLYRDLPEEVDIICSPKNTGGEYSRIREDLLRRITALKFIVSVHDKNYGQVAEVGQSDYGIPVYVQPMDENDRDKNASNLALAVSIACKQGVRLSLQVHKIAGIE